VAFGEVVEFKQYGTQLTPSYGSLMLIDQAPHPNAAKVFVNWLLTKEGQTAYATTMKQTSRRLDVPVDHVPPNVRLKPDGKYTPTYKEDMVEMPPALDALLQELFAR
jgi:ABC-type Fe3+ transport system substrate-binding protein